MTQENQAEQNGGADLTEVIRAALPPRADLRLTPGDGAELAARYRATLQNYLEHSVEYLESGDYQQAAEKSWGAYAESVKSIAAENGYRLSHHGHIIRAAGRLASLAAQDDSVEGQALRDGLSSARSLHQHFYENDLDPDDVHFSAYRVAAAIDLMQQRFSVDATELIQEQGNREPGTPTRPRGN